MPTVPTYSLYGVNSNAPLLEQLHFESIPERSGVNDWEIKPHRHERFFQVLYVHQGGGTALLDEAEYPLAGATVVTVPPRCVHGFRFTPDVDGIVITMTDHYLHALLAGVPDALPLFERPYHDHFGAPASHADATVLAGALGLFRAEINAVSLWRGAALAALLSLLLVGIARRIAAAGATGTPPAGRTARHFQQFQQLVEARFRQHQDLAGYAATLGISPTQLNRICQQLAGRSALQLIHSRLVVEAQRDLLYSDLDIKQIAATLGFADAAYFTRFFARQVGQTPTAFRQHGRARLPAPRAARR
ncbi:MULTISPECIES: helix-turn-helix domain-containing protein [Cupriavidus]